MAKKYENLTTYLLSKLENITLSFSEIEQIIGNRISAAYIKCKNISSSKFALGKSIIDGGYNIINVDYDSQLITLVKGEITNQVVRKKTKRRKNNRLNVLYPNEFSIDRFLQKLIAKGLTIVYDNLDNPIVELTENNSNIIENEIINNPRYPLNVQNIVNESFDFLNINLVDEAVRTIDKDNYTFAKTRPGSIEEIVSFITNSINDFEAKVKRGDTSLIDELINSKTINKEKSLCSKVCKYMNEYTQENHFDYFINDSVVRAMLPYYLRYYENEELLRKVDTLEKRKSITYLDLFACLEWLFVNHSSNLTRSKLDHILWYSYKSYKNKE